jgi:hypothetical protein
MLHHTSVALFESIEVLGVLSDPANGDWLAAVGAVCGPLYEDIERRYYAALYHFRQQAGRSALPGRTTVSAPSRHQALQGLLSLREQRKTTPKQTASRDSVAIFVDPRPDGDDESLPQCLRDLSSPAPSLDAWLGGAGRPPCDALCLMRAFLGAPILGVGDSPTDVHRLLRSNPTYARACGFLGREAFKQPGELTSRRLPSQSTCDEFSEIMTRYGLWHHARVRQVQENLATGVVEIDDTISFDATHLVSNSHCANVVPEGATTDDGKRPKHRKVPRVRKTCDCGKAQWEGCEHAWSPTDEGAAIVVKGPTRVYWAHKASVAAFGDSEIPIDVRVLQYAADHDGKTLVPHLELLGHDFPEVIAELSHVLADSAYVGNAAAVATFGKQARLTVPVRPRQTKESVADGIHGIDRFTPTGVPVCVEGYRFKMLGRDVQRDRFIWRAPDSEAGTSVCLGCPLASACLSKGTRRHIRVERADFPHLDWDHPQHLTRNADRYQRRTGVERAIKRLKVDLKAANLTHRDAPRVQAHLDRKLLTLHLLLKSHSSG